MRDRVEAPAFDKAVRLGDECWGEAERKTDRYLDRAERGKRVAVFMGRSRWPVYVASWPPKKARKLAFGGGNRQREDTTE